MRQHAKTTSGATIPAELVRVGVWTVVSAVVLLGSPLLIPGEGSAEATEPSYVGLAGYEPSALALYRPAAIHEHLGEQPFLQNRLRHLDRP